MDPNANLAEQNDILLGGNTRADRARLTELREALTEWIGGGGFHPDWSRYPTAARHYGITGPTQAPILSGPAASAAAVDRILRRRK